MSKAPGPPSRDRDPRPGSRAPSASLLLQLGRVLSALSPRRLFRAFFVDQLRLSRRGRHVQLVLRSPQAAAAHPAGEAAPAHPGMTQMRQALTGLLDSRAGSRAVLRHLAALEHNLRVQSAPFFHQLSPSSLQAMLRQLQGLIAPPPAPGVALLMTELLSALEDRRAAEAPEEAADLISSFFVDHKLEVKELGASALELPVAETDGAADRQGERHVA